MTLGQFGTSGALATSEMTYSTFSVGGNLKAGERLSLGLDANYTVGKEEMQPLGLRASPEILARLTGFTYDFTTWHTYVDLESTSWDATLRTDVRFNSSLSGVFSYTYVDFNDNAPYLTDLTGNLDIVRLGLRWTL